LLSAFLFPTQYPTMVVPQLHKEIDFNVDSISLLSIIASSLCEIPIPIISLPQEPQVVKKREEIIEVDIINPASPASTYFDRSSTPIPSYYKEQTMCIENMPNFNFFSQRLHAVLSDERFQQIIAWLPHGRGWRILKPKLFERFVLAKYFGTIKYASFLRQLQVYGFRQITTNSYCHEMFLRGKPHICDYIRRLNKDEKLRRKKEGSKATKEYFECCLLNPICL